MESEAHPDEITLEALQPAGFEDPAHALSLIRQLAGQGVTDIEIAQLLPQLITALAASPDPDRALAGFARWFAAVGSPYAYLQMLRRHPIALDLFCLVTGSSQVFSDLLARQPEAFEIVANPGLRGGSRSAAAYYRDIAALLEPCRRPELKRDVLRRWKAREMLRIGVRDLARLAEMPATAREFSNLADACVQAACDIVQAELGGLSPPGVAVIAMGKLGGQELNYSSDIDLMFVTADTLPEWVALTDGRRMETHTYLNRLAERLTRALQEDGPSGHVFRVDLRLRPEGRFGSLVRSLAGYRAYYEHWAEGWERQALLKARFIAGDRAVGEAFEALIEPFVYRRIVTQSFLEEIRANKRRIEQTCALEGETERNIKTGYGGIRDVEFLTQRLQLLHGGTHPRLRTRNTLGALQRLRRASLLSDEDAHQLADDYIFLRNVEHRLQLLQGFQTQTLPAPDDGRERTRLARRMGFTAREPFEAELKWRRDRVHAALQKLFYGDPAPIAEIADVPQGAWADLPDLLDQIDTPSAKDQLAARLTAAGFHQIPAALQALRVPMRGNEFGGMPPDTAVEFIAIAPRLLGLAARAADPDVALAGFETLATAVPNRAHLYAACDDSPQMLERLILLAGASPPLLNRLCRHQEWLDAVLESDEAAAQELPARVLAAPDYEARLNAIARFQQRETLRIGARDIWEESSVPDTLRALTGVAEAVLQALMSTCCAEVIARHPNPDFARRVLEHVAIIGLGKLGGEELGYASDWDVIFVYSAPPGQDGPDWFAISQTLVERVIAAGQALPVRGANVEIDLRLRPWGRKGALIHSLRSLIRYHRTEAETWERQAALKARQVAGSPEVGRRCLRILEAVSYGRGLDAGEDAAVRAMKRRIESERLKPSERETDLKLGHGGLSDIEWLAQRLQMLHGGAYRRIQATDRARQQNAQRPQPPHGRHWLALRLPNTLRALSALATAHLLDNAEADHLIASYRLLTRVRNALWLQTAAAQDAFPADPARRRALARQLGYTAPSQSDSAIALWEDLHAHMQESRRIFERRFYETV
jgi:glutamate-ammonia-ligase adenylyltransferase